MKEMDVYETLEKRAKEVNYSVLVDDTGFAFAKKERNGEVRISRRFGWSGDEIQSQLLPDQKQLFFIKKEATRNVI